MRTVEHIVDSEILCNVSQLVATFAASFGVVNFFANERARSLNLAELAEKAIGLSLAASEEDEELIDVYEHWMVSPWLARKLIDVGEAVEENFAGLTIWARTTTDAMVHDPSLAEIASRINTSPVAK